MMASGEPGVERIICVHEELFLRGWDRRKDVVPDIAKLLPEVRRKCELGELQAASTMATDEARRQLVAAGAPQNSPVSPHPAFDLNIRTARSGVTTAYRRQLDLESGETRTSWRDATGGLELAAFTSREVDANVVRIMGTAGRKLDVVLSLDETPGRAGNVHDLDIDAAILEVKSAAEAGGQVGWLTYDARYGHDNGGYAGLARVTTKGGRLEGDSNRLRVTGADEILVVLRITPADEGEPSRQTEVKEELESLEREYDALLAPHATQNGEMFTRVTLDLGQAEGWRTVPVEEMLADVHVNGPSPLFFEQIHASGRHLLIASCGKYPPPLQGIWGGGWKPAWIGGFVLDTNLNLAISNVSTGDLPECAESYFGYVESVLGGWRKNAERYLGTRGFLVAHYADPETGFLCHFDGYFPWMYWPAGAGWNIMPFYEHAMRTGDLDFLRQRVLPLYRETADFYDDYLTLGDDGEYHVIPSISPENFTGGSLLTRDSTMDIAVAREVFGHLVTMGHALDLDPDDIARWQAYHDKMPAYRINEDGALAEWCDPAFIDNYDHRHNSHLYPVFPGTEFLETDADPLLLMASRVALDKRFASDTESAHGLVHVAMMAARLRDTEKIAVSLDRFARRNYVYDGLVTSHDPDHAIYNLDSVLSLPRLLVEMVAFSQPGRLQLMPACPPEFPPGSLSGIRIHGGHKLDVTWRNGELVAAVLHAAKDEVLTVIRDGRELKVTLKAGISRDLSPSAS